MAKMTTFEISGPVTAERVMAELRKQGLLEDDGPRPVSEPPGGTVRAAQAVRVVTIAAPLDPDDMLLIEDVAQITRRSVSTLRWLRHNGEGPPATRQGRRLYFRRGAVMAWIAEQEDGASVPAGAEQHGNDRPAA